MKLHYHIPALSFPMKFDILDEHREVLYRAETKLSWGHVITIKNIHKEKVAELDDHFFNYFPYFKVKIGEEEIGGIKRVLSLKQTHYDFQYQGWMIRGLMHEPRYEIINRQGQVMARYRHDINTHEHTIEIKNPKNHLKALCFVLCVEGLLTLES